MSERDGYQHGVTELGGKVVNPSADSPGSRSAVLADPQGTVFTISQLLVG